MSAREEERAAGDLLESLHALGRGAGAGAAIWSRVIVDELKRHEDAKAQFVAETARGEDWDRYCGSGLVIALAVGQVLAFEERVRKLTGDAELAKARKTFDTVAPDAGAIRDLVAHLAEYAVGSGLRQDPQPGGRRHGLPIPERNVTQAIYWTDRGESYVLLAGQQHSLQVVADAAVELAEIVERARTRGVERARKRLIEAGRSADELGLP